MSTYILFCISNNRPFLFDRETGYTNIHPIFKDKGLIINRIFIDDLIRLMVLYDELVDLYSSSELFDYFIQSIKHYLLHDIFPHLTEPRETNFYNLLKNMCTKLNHNEYTDLDSLKKYRQEIVFKYMHMDVNLTQLFLKYDTYFYGKIQQTFDVNTNITDIAILYDGQIAVARGRVEIINPVYKNYGYVIEKSDDIQSLISLPHNRLLGMTFENTETLYDIDTGDKIYTGISNVHASRVIILVDTIIILGSDNLLEVKDLITGESIFSIPSDGENGYIKCMALYKDLIIVGFYHDIPGVYSLTDKCFKFLLGTQCLSLNQIFIYDSYIIGIAHNEVIVWKDFILQTEFSFVEILNVLFISTCEIVISDRKGLKIWNFITGKLIFSLDIKDILEDSMFLWMDTELIMIVNGNLGIFNIKSKQFIIRDYQSSILVLRHRYDKIVIGTKQKTISIIG